MSMASFVSRQVERSKAFFLLDCCASFSCERAAAREPWEREEATWAAHTMRVQTHSFTHKQLRRAAGHYSMGTCAASRSANCLRCSSRSISFSSTSCRDDTTQGAPH
jgi:hypothetical protein